MDDRALRKKEYEDLLNYCKADNRAFPINWYKVMEILETRKLPRHCWGYYDSLILGYYHDYNVKQKIERFHKQIRYGAFMTHSPTHFKKLKDFVIVGNSLGGHVGLIYAKLFPILLKGLVLTGSSGLYENSMGDSYPKREDYKFIRKKT